jgi:Ca-activated chloride channel family protein
VRYTGVVNAISAARRLAPRGLAYIAIFGLGQVLCQEPTGTSVLRPQSEAYSAPSGDAGGTPPIHVNSDLVVIPVTVTDHKGRIVGGLQKEHFALYEDKVEQAITHFASEEAPVSIILVLDTSDSMRPKLAKAREAVAALLDNANPRDEFSLVEFSQVARLAVKFTTKAEEVRDRLAVVQTGGGTALLDAVKVALDEMKNACHTRKAIIIISDGEDNASHYSVAELRNAVRQADTLVYAIGMIDWEPYSQAGTAQRLTGSALLDEIAKQTGGRLFQVSGLKQLPAIAAKIGAWLRNQYILAYAPSSQQKNGRYHRIQVKITRPDGFPRLRGYWRLGYYTPAE